MAILLRGEEEEGDEAGAAEGGRRGTDWLYREIVSRIRGCDAETPLNAAQVAQQLRISPGYVHRILARHATSFGEQLREAHLQQAYEMLADARPEPPDDQGSDVPRRIQQFLPLLLWRSGSASAVPPASCASAGPRPPSPDTQ